MRSAPPSAAMVFAVGRPWHRALLALLLAGATLCLLSTPAHAQWKWRDRNGQITVSDLPPPRDVPEKDILGRPAPPVVRAAPTAAAASSPDGGAPAAAAASAPAAKSTLETEVDKRRKAAEAEAQAKAKADEQKLATQRRENCARARSYMAQLDSGMRMARMNAKGEYEVLDDRMRADEVRRTNEVIAADCR